MTVFNTGGKIGHSGDSNKSADPGIPTNDQSGRDGKAASGLERILC